MAWLTSGSVWVNLDLVTHIGWPDNPSDPIPVYMASKTGDQLTRLVLPASQGDNLRSLIRTGFLPGEMKPETREVGQPKRVPPK